jgi:GNAT superfamily N-acetyltransferase
VTPSAPGVLVRGPLYGQGAACEAVLRALPDWFGIEASVVQYVKDVDDLPAFVAVEAARPPDDSAARDRGRAAAPRSVRTVGLIALKPHALEAAEVHVMGVLRECHRAGVGRALLRAAEDWLRAQGSRFLTVKTLSATHPDPDYAATRAFYLAMDFVPLMELPDLWGPGNPCLVMVKVL